MAENKYAPVHNVDVILCLPLLAACRPPGEMLSMPRESSVLRGLYPAGYLLLECPPTGKEPH